MPLLDPSTVPAAAGSTDLRPLGEHVLNPNLYGEPSALWCPDCHRIAVQPDQHDCSRKAAA